MKLSKLVIAIILLTSAGCTSTRKVGVIKDDGKIEVFFLQVNDVYEIAPLAGGREGGMARVATLKKQYRAKNSNTFLMMAGDFLSPSVYNSIKFEGIRVRGRQMIETMNVAGMDFAIFGNHEFDIAESELQQRINESGFKWISSNTFHKVNSKLVPFGRNGVVTTSFPQSFIMNVRDADGTEAKIGFMAITLFFNKAAYVGYTDPLTTAKNIYSQLKDSVDAVVALTHQTMEDDIVLAKEIPGLAMIIGGHDHDNRFEKVGNVVISKAHANAKSAYVLQMAISKKDNKVKVTSQLKYLNESIELDSSTNVVVQKWMDVARDNYASIGFDALKVVLDKGEPLDGRESEIRKKSTNLTRIIVKAMDAAAPSADVAILNSGSVRVDDILPMPVTQYDILRSLPYGGGIREVNMKGSLLAQILTTGRNNSGKGNYLQYSEKLVYDFATQNWKINNEPINPDKLYRVAMTDFLLTGGETNLEYLTPQNRGIVKTYDAQTSINNPQSDIRLTVVRYLENL